MDNKLGRNFFLNFESKSSNNEAKPSPGLFGSSTNNASSGSMFGDKKEETKPTGLFGGSGGGFGGLGKEFEHFMNS